MPRDQTIRYQELAQREATDAAIIVEAQGRVLYWNTGAVTVFGFTSAEAVGRPLFELLFVAPGITAERTILVDTLRMGAIHRESLLCRKDGSLVQVDLAGKLLHESVLSEPVILLSARDVTAVRASRDARWVADKFGDLLESMPDGIVMVNRTGRIVFTNRNATRMFGYPAGELLGATVESLMPERVHAAHLGHRAHFLSEPRSRPMGAGTGMELRGRRKDGSEFPVEISLSPIASDGGMLVSSSIRDITERQRAAQALRDKNLDLERASRAKDRFLASMSHELRTPLNAIIGFTGTLIMKLPGPLTAEQDDQLRIVQRSARHLLALINDLLDVAKIEADKTELQREPLDCVGVILEAAGIVRPDAQRKGLTLEVEAGAAPVMLLTDRRLLSQILLNLMDNAIKFTEAGGVSIKVTAGPGNEASQVLISVTDTGPGLDDAALQRMFEPFSRLAREGAPVTPGTGLGLHLSRRLAELLGGSLVCHSRPGAGSTFIVALPPE